MFETMIEKWERIGVEMFIPDRHTQTERKAIISFRD